MATAWKPLAGLTSSPVGNIPAAGGSDWFAVSFPQSGRPGAGSPSIGLTRNDGNAYSFDIRASCGSGALCADSTSYSFVDNADPNGGWNTNNTPWPSTLYIRVKRVSAGLTCGSYQLTVTR